MTESPLRLVHEPAKWTIETTTAETIVLWAHGYSVKGDQHVFSLLLEGLPAVELPVVSVPSSLIAQLAGG